MQVDKRPGVAEALASLYPAEEEKPLPNVKQEEEKRVVQRESKDTKDDIENPKAVVGTSKPPSGTNQVLDRNEVSKSDPRFNKVHNCLRGEGRQEPQLWIRTLGAPQPLLGLLLQPRPLQGGAGPWGGQQGLGGEGGG